MNLKSTIVQGENYQLYDEMFDDENIYLTINNADFEVTNLHVTIKIPLEIWAVIRQHGEPELRYADWTDDEVRDFVIKEIDERIEEYNQTLKNEGERAASLKAFCGALVYGSPIDNSKEEQIEIAFEHIIKQRDIHSKIQSAIQKANYNIIDQEE